MTMIEQNRKYVPAAERIRQLEAKSNRPGGLTENESSVLRRLRSVTPTPVVDAEPSRPAPLRRPPGRPHGGGSTSQLTDELRNLGIHLSDDTSVAFETKG